MLITSPGTTFLNAGAIIGGNGGAAGGTVLGAASGSPGAGGAGIVGSGITVINAGAIIGGLRGDGAIRANAVTFTGGINVLELQSGSAIIGNVVAFSAADTLRLGGAADASFNVSQVGPAAQYRGFGVFEKSDSSTWTLTGTTASVTPWTVNGGTLAISADNNLGATSGGLTLNGGALQALASFSLDPSRPVTLGAAGGTVNTGSGIALGVVGAIAGPGGLTKTGDGILTLGGNNTYSGGTTVNQGTLALLSASGSLNPSGALTVNGGTFDLGNNVQTVGALSGAGGTISLGTGTLTTNSAATTTLASAITGSGGMALQGGGVLNLTGNCTYTGPTTVTGGSTLYANGTLASSVTLEAGGMLGGSGTIGGFTSNGGILAPGNSIGTLTVTGNFVSNGGTYQVEVNPAGQNDRVNVGGTATINGGTVQVQVDGGNYVKNTTYTILHAAGGVNGTYSGVDENFAFLTASLGYDADDVFLTLALLNNAFSGFFGNTANQRAVGYALDRSYANASGDFATVIGALPVLDTQQGPLALSAISGEPWADFGTINLASNTLFMNALGQQMALARGGQGNGQRLALAQACDASACDATSPFSVWASGLGGLGSVQGDGNASTLTYNFGGAAAGIDYRFDPRFLVGIGVGYTHGTQWVNSFMGSGWTDAVSVAAYGSYTQGAFYADALAGYAYSNNQLQRQIVVSGLQQRTASGSTGANQFLGQAELGYKVPVYAPAAATLTPFARMQVMSVNQSAFSEWGANSLSLNVQQQTTNSVRSTLGAELDGAFGLGNGRSLDLGLRLGWQHEYAYTGRPITASFAGAPEPTSPSTARRRSATPPSSASGQTAVADNTSVYLRYDGEIGSGNDNHAFMAGLRLSW